MKKELIPNKGQHEAPINRQEFQQALDRIDANYLAMADKLDATRKEILGALDRQRINLERRLDQLESKFNRFVNAIVRLAEGGIKCRLNSFRLEDRAAAAAKPNAAPETPGISDESLHQAEQKLKPLS